MEKILDVILSSPGTRIGQASECFVYWKDDRRNDTWGLNFTSPIDAKQFRECCDFSKSSARYLYKNGLRLGSKSSPASPTKQEPQCTCTTMHLSEKQKQLRMQSSRGKKVNFFRIFAIKSTLGIICQFWLFWLIYGYFLKSGNSDWLDVINYEILGILAILWIFWWYFELLSGNSDWPIQLRAEHDNFFQFSRLKSFLNQQNSLLALLRSFDHFRIV